MTTTTTNAAAVKTVRCKITSTDTIVTVHGATRAVSLSMRAALATREPLRSKLLECELGEDVAWVDLTLAEMHTILALSQVCESPENPERPKPPTCEAPSSAPAPVAIVPTPPPATVATPAPATIPTVPSMAAQLDREASAALIRQVSVSVARTRRTRRRQADIQAERLEYRAAVAKIAEEEEIYMVNYDIPDSVNFPNPSSVFWRMGLVRDQLSYWIAPESVWQSGPVQRWVREARAAGVQKIRARRISAEDRAELLGDARQSLLEECRRAHASLIASLDTASRELEAATRLAEESQGTADRAQTKYDNAVRKALATSRDSLESAIRNAERYDAQELVGDLVAALRDANTSAAQAFNASARLRRVKPVELPTV